MSSSDSFPAWPKSTSPSCARSRTKMFAGCGSAWKKPCRKTIVIHASAIRVATSRRSSGRIAARSRSATFVPWRNSSVRTRAGRVLPDHARDDDPVVAREVAVEGLGVPRLVPVVELEPDRARELVHELLRVHELERLHPLAKEARRLVQQPEVGLDLLGRRRALDLDRDLLPVREHGPVDLPDRGRRDRGQVELEERLVEREVELRLDDLAHLLERESATRRPAGREARRRCPAGRRPGRVERSCPNFTNVGPSSSSISRSRRPRSETVATSRRVARRRGRRAGFGAGRSRSRGGPPPARSPRAARGSATAVAAGGHAADCRAAAPAGPTSSRCRARAASGGARAGRRGARDRSTARARRRRAPRAARRPSPVESPRRCASRRQLSRTSRERAAHLAPLDAEPVRELFARARRRARARARARRSRRG